MHFLVTIIDAPFQLAMISRLDAHSAAVQTRQDRGTEFVFTNQSWPTFWLFAFVLAKYARSPERNSGIRL